MPETLDSVLFHEITHGYHELLRKNRRNHHIMPYIAQMPGSKIMLQTLRDAWTDDEEMYTITGFYMGSSILSFDPINTNMYELFKAHKLGILHSKITLRIFHKDYNWYLANFPSLKDIQNLLFPIRKYSIDDSI